jgi:vesicle transport through interaction with t-SNAREs protein 1
MSNLIDADAGTERFSGYEAELKLVQADLSQQIEQIKETTGEPRKAAISRAERALEEAEELVSYRLITHVAPATTPTTACMRPSY